MVMIARVGIVGLGLIGGSLGLAIRRACPGTDVVGVDPDPNARNGASACGAVHRASADLAAVGGVELVVLAAPVRANLALLEQLARHANPPAVVTDVGSTKRAIVRAARALGCTSRFVGGHPVAGAALGGVAHARADLFEGRPWVLTPEADAAEAAVSGVEDLARAVGARPVRTSADEHDRVMAWVSHLPQLVSSVLMDAAGSAAGEAGLAVAGRGLADVTRLASSPGDIWRDICETNADHIGAALLQMAARLTDLAGMLQTGGLDQLFASARSWRARQKRARESCDFDADSGSSPGGSATTGPATTSCGAGGSSRPSGRASAVPAPSRATRSPLRANAAACCTTVSRVRHGHDRSHDMRGVLSVPGSPACRTRRRGPVLP